jgi:hypothetical protein
MAVGVEGHAPNSLLLHERCEYYMNAASKAEFRDLSAQHIQTLDMRAGIVMNVTPEDRPSACSSLKRASLVTRAIQQTRGVHRMRKHYSLEARDHRPDNLSNGGWTKWCIAPVVGEPGLIGFECPNSPCARCLAGIEFLCIAGCCGSSATRP